MLCLMCGQDNPEGAGFCSNCKAVIPKTNIVSSAPPPIVNRRYMLIKTACDKVRSGEWDLNKFGEFVYEVKQSLLEKVEEIKDIGIPEEAMDEFVEELETGYTGVELYLRGVELLILFLSEQKAEHLDQGIVLIAEGNDKINEAMRINRENRRKLEELYSDTEALM